MKHKLNILLIALAFMAISAFASAQTWDISATADDYVTATLDGSRLTISGEGNMKDLYPYSPFKYNEEIINVIVEDGVTSIGDGVFSHCGRLRKITIPNSVTSIAYSAFENCVNLTEIVIPDSVKSIGAKAFNGCSNLKGIIIPNGVTTIGKETFAGCVNLTSVTIPNSVTTIGNYAFAGCANLTSVTIPNSVTYIAYGAFENCVNLTNISIPDEVRNIEDGVFQGCSGLTNITIGDSIKSIGTEAFNGCSNLKEITIPNGVTTIGKETFAGCVNLTDITIPNSVKSIREKAFSGCTSLKEITIPNSINIGIGAFAGCANLTSVTIPNSVTNIEQDTLGDSISVEIIIIAYKNGIGIGRHAFMNCTSLTEVTIPNGVTSIEWGAFENCISLTELTIPESVTSIGWGAFGNCTSLTEVTIPNGVTSIGDGAFYGCSGLTEITIPNSVKSIREKAFSGCYGLKKVTLGNNLTSIGEGAFKGCAGLTEITIPNGVKNIKSHTFLDCWDLKKVIIPNSVTSIESDAFENCISLTELTIPESVTSIGFSAFDGCSGLTKIKFVGNMPNFFGYYHTFDNIPKQLTMYYPYGNTTWDNYNGINMANWRWQVIFDTGEGGSEVQTQRLVYSTPATKPEIPAREGYIFAGWYTDNKTFETEWDFSSDITNDTTLYAKWTSRLEIGYPNASDVTATLADSTLTVSGKGKTMDWTYDTSPLKANANIANVIIEDMVTHIGDYTFNGCPSLKEINVSEDNARYCSVDGVLFGKDKTELIQYPASKSGIMYTIPSSVKSIRAGAFEDCDNLTEIIIPNSVESIESGTFNGCDGLKEINVSEDNANYCSVGGVLFSKDKTKLLGYPTGRSDTTYTIPNNVTHIEYASFSGCRRLKEIDIPNSVKSIGEKAFAYTGLTAIRFFGDKPTMSTDIILGVHTNRLTLYRPIGNTTWNGFSSKKVTVAYLGNIVTFDTGKGGRKVKPQTIADGMKVARPSNPRRKNYFLIGWYTDNKTFKTKWDFKTDTVTDDITLYAKWARGWDISAITKWDISATKKWDISATANDNVAATLSGGTLTISGTGNMRGWRYDHQAPWYAKRWTITKVIIEDGVTNIGKFAFFHCRSLTKVIISNSVKSIGKYAFEGCRNIREAVIGNGVTTIMDNAFIGCAKLSGIIIPESVTTIGEYAFWRCHNLTEIIIPNSVDSIGYNAFAYCKRLIEINVSKDNAYYCSKDGVLFSKDKTKLIQYPIGRPYTTYNIPESVITVGGYAFAYCKSLTEVSIPNSVTSIGSAFKDCGNLKEVTISSSVTSIGSSTFENCSSLKKITFTGNRPRFYSYVFYKIPNGRLTLYYPCGNTTWDGYSNGSITIACWGKIVAFNTGDDGGEVERQTVAYGATATKPEIPAREGYIFAGWYTDNKTFETEWDFNADITNDITLYAKWTSRLGIGFPNASDVTVTLSDSTLTVSGKGQTMDWTYDTSPLKANANIANVIIEDGVTHIGNYAFNGCANLREINVSEDNAHYCSVDGVLFSKDKTKLLRFPTVRSDTTYTIPNSVKSIRAGAFEDCDNLTEIIIPKSLTTIGDYAFAKCDNLNEITIPNSVESIGYGAFNGCDSLKGINVSEDNAHYCSEGGVLFNKDKTRLLQYPIGRTETTYTIPNGVTHIEYASFSGYRSLKGIDIPNSVKTIGGKAFAYTGLMAIRFFGDKPTMSTDIISGVRTNRLTLYHPIGNTTWNGFSSKEVTIAYLGNIATFDAEQKDSTPEAIAACWGNIVTFDTGKGGSKVKPQTIVNGTTAARPANTRRENYALVGWYTDNTTFKTEWDFTTDIVTDDITLYAKWTPEWNISKTTKDNVIAKLADNTLTIRGTGNMRDWYLSAKPPSTSPWYYERSTITKVIIEDGVTNIAISAFDGCGGLKEIVISKNITKIEESVFNDCIALNEIIVSSDNEYYCSEGGVLFNKNKTKLLRYPIGRSDTIYTVPDGVKSIGNRAFNNCSNLTSIIIPNSVESIGDDAFYRCTGLTKIIIPESITAIGGSAFSGCSKLTGITIPGSVKSMGWHVFNGCGGLKNVTIGNGVMNIERGAFGNCVNLTDIIIPKSVKSIGYGAFEGCKGLINITIGDGVKSIGTQAFVGCTSLTDVTIPNSVESIGSEAFAGCKGLTDIIIGDGLKKIVSSAFSNCTNLNKIVIGNGVTDIENYALSRSSRLKEINVSEDNAHYCSENGVLFNKDKTALIKYPTVKADTTYTIPDGVKSIGYRAFYNCGFLAEITIPKSVTIIEDAAFAGCSKLTGITIPDSVKSMGEYAFSHCKGLTDITIPKSVTGIGNYTFNMCVGLTGVTFLGDKPTITTYNRTFYGIPANQLTLYYPCGNKTWRGYSYKGVSVRCLAEAKLNDKR